MSDEREPLWSDMRIGTTTYLHSTYKIAGDIACMSRGSCLILLTEMRDDYEARIAELEAQLAQTWQPLPDGAYGASNDIIVAGQHLCMFVDGGDVGDNLPDNIRLCRLVTKGESHE